MDAGRSLAGGRYGRAAAAQNRAVTAVIAAGFSWAEGNRWARAAPQIVPRPDLLAACAARWRDEGFAVVDAVGWFGAEVGVVQAQAWVAAGFTPHQARRVIAAITHDHPDRAASGEPWRSSGIPAEWAVRYAAAGCTLAEARTLEAERDAGVDHASNLETLAALRGLGSA